MDESNIEKNLFYLKLPFIREHYEEMAKKAAQEQWTHLQYVAEMIQGDADFRQDRAIQRRIRMAKFPVIKTLDHFEWTWPKQLNRLQVQIFPFEVHS